jgi:hypothetical protein
LGLYQSNAEATAQLLKINNVPVISPLSLKTWGDLTEIVQTIPSPEVLK